MCAIANTHQRLNLLLKHLKRNPKLANIAIRHVANEEIFQSGNTDDLSETATGVNIRGRCFRQAVSPLVWRPQELPRSQSAPQLRLRYDVKSSVLVRELG